MFNLGNLVILKRTTANGLLANLTKFLTLDYPILMGGNRVEAFEGNLRFLEEAAIVTSSW